LKDRIENDRQLMRLQYYSYLPVFGAKFADAIPSNDTEAFELYLRIAGIVMAYSFTDDEDGTVCMVPVADILNHVSRKNNARLFYSSQSLKMCALKTIEAGEEIFNTYGELDNVQLLQKHSFVEPEPTPFEEVRIKAARFASGSGQLLEDLTRWV